MLWVPPFLSYELWKQRIELSQNSIQTCSYLLIYQMVIWKLPYESNGYKLMCTGFFQNGALSSFPILRVLFTNPKTQLFPKSYVLVSAKWALDIGFFQNMFLGWKSGNKRALKLIFPLDQLSYIISWKKKKSFELWDPTRKERDNLGYEPICAERVWAMSPISVEDA